MKKFTITLIALLFVYFSNNLKAQSFADSIKVPNVFTPNMDGINDVFKASIPNELEIGNYSLSIYDRYGVLIFETKKARQHWDGRTTSGLPCSEGTYFYLLQLSVSSQQIELTGFVQLFR
ncbi:MAG: gliding motility-associated C-terminal domain-containing protein [Bacteroidetes bacterium]|nr:gliding motility-associated C-terminal domain-containing protein [Bacteroidota bacterium]